MKSFLCWASPPLLLLFAFEAGPHCVALTALHLLRYPCLSLHSAGIISMNIRFLDYRVCPAFPLQISLGLVFILHTSAHTENKYAFLVSTFCPFLAVPTFPKLPFLHMLIACGFIEELHYPVYYAFCTLNQILA